MKFEWKDRTDTDLLVLELAAQYLCEKVSSINHLIRNHEQRMSEPAYLCLDSVTDGMYAVQHLLRVDFEWIFGFMQLRRGNDEGLVIMGNTPADVLHPGYSFEMRYMSICDEATDARLCCVYPHIFVVKDTDAS